MKRLFIIATATIVVCLIIGGALLVRHRHTKPKTLPTIVEQKKNAPKQSAASAAQSNQPAQSVPVSSNISLSDLSATESGDSVHAAATVKNSSDTSASCVFTFENPNDRPVVRQVNVSSNGTVCDSGNIPAEEFTFLGSWNLTLRYYSSGNTNQAVATTTVTIQ